MWQNLYVLNLNDEHVGIHGTFYFVYVNIHNKAQ